MRYMITLSYQLVNNFPETSLQFPHKPAIVAYPEPVESIHNLKQNWIKTNFNIILQSTLSST
jgi:hypothetical protein